MHWQINNNMVLYKRCVHSIPCYSARMNLGKLHLFRIAILALVGIAVALATIGGILLSLKVDPNKLSLADRVDPTQAQVFIQTVDPIFLMKTINQFGSLMGERKLGPENLKTGDLYELVILENGSGSQAWVLYVHNTRKNSAATFVSDDDPGLLLPINKHRSSLAFSPLFTHIPEGNHTVVWFKIETFPLPSSPVSTLIQSAMSTATEGLVTWKNSSEGSLFLRGLTLKESTMRLPWSGDNNPLFWFAVANPANLTKSLDARLAAKNQTLQEGIAGMLKSKLAVLTGRTDLEQIAQEILAGPFAVSIIRGSGSALSYAIIGTALSRNSIDQWTEALASKVTAGSVRRLQFYKGENTRTDISLDSAGKHQELGTKNGWTLKRIGIEPDSDILIAVDERHYIISNTVTSLEELTKKSDSSRVGLSASIDIPWTLAEAEKNVPFLGLELREFIRYWLGESLQRLSWDTNPISGGIRIDWVLEQRF